MKIRIIKSQHKSYQHKSLDNI